MGLLEELREARAAILGAMHVCDLHNCPATSDALSRAHVTVQEAEELIDAIRGVLEDERIPPFGQERALINITSYMRDCHIEVNT